MKFTPLGIPDIIVISPEIIYDERGYFAEIFRQNEFENILNKKINFVQENESKSAKNTLRGLHFQEEPFAQSKLVKAVNGKVLDIAVDIRKESKTFGKYVSYILDSNKKEQIYIPRGFAHGFLVLSKSAIISYKVDNYYSPSHEKGFHYSDPLINIDWGNIDGSVITSHKDANLPPFREINF